MPRKLRSHSDPGMIHFLQWEDRISKYEFLQISLLGYYMINSQFYGKEINRQIGRFTLFPDFSHLIFY